MALVTRAREAVALLCVWGLALATSADDAAAPTEYEVKAAFLYNFAKFIEWPADPRRGEPEAFVITILGSDPFGGIIDHTLHGKTVGHRKVVVRRARHPDEVGDSQILFISGSEGEQLAQVLKRLEGAAVLTVGDMERFAERGGVIRLRTDHNRVRLDINVAAAERARLKISSELLKLARIVGQRG